MARLSIALAFVAALIETAAAVKVLEGGLEGLDEEASGALYFDQKAGVIYEVTTSVDDTAVDPNTI